jgi:hypothetical protein
LRRRSAGSNDRGGTDATHASIQQRPEPGPRNPHGEGAGLSEDDARAFADQHATPEAAKAELDRRAETAKAEAAQRRRLEAVMTMPAAGELPEGAARQIAQQAQTPEAARASAVDAVMAQREREVELGTPAQTTASAPADRVENASLSGPSASVGHSWDHGDGLRAKMIDGLAARLVPGREPTIGREFASMRLDDMAMVSLREAGARGISFPRNRAAAVQMAMSASGMHTTSDFSGILAGAAQTAVSEGYRVAQPEIVSASRMLSAPDFRERTMYRLSSGPELTEVNEAGEIEAGTFAEEGEPAPNVKVYARLFHLSYQAIVNDDVSAFAELPRKMVEGAASTVRGVLCGLLEANSGAGVTMRDGAPLFDAAHGNVAGTPDDLSLETLTAAIAAMRRQTGAQGEILAIRPRFLMVPPELEGTARGLAAQINPTTVGDVNPWAEVIEVLVEPGLSDAARWYLVGDPASADGLAHAYLDGAETPQVDQEQGFQRLGISFRVRLHFGASAIDWRSLYANDGA